MDIDIKALREKSDEELKGMLAELLEEQFKLRMQHATQQLSNTALLRKVRRNIARVKTVLREKQG